MIKIATIEDEENIRQEIVRYIKKGIGSIEGVEVDVYESAERYLLVGGRYDLVISDIELQSVIFCGQFIHAILFCSLLLRLLSFDFSLRIFLAQAGQYLDAPEPGTYSTPHTVQFLAGIAAHRFVGMICNSSTKPMNL